MLSTIEDLEPHRLRRISPVHLSYSICLDLHRFRIQNRELKRVFQLAILTKLVAAGILKTIS
jgi:hypothetical protein